MDASSLVLTEGAGCSGWGRLFRTAEGDWFDPPLPAGSVRHDPRPSRFSIPVESADFIADGGAEAEQDFVTIYGVWLGDRIRVERRTTERPPWQRAPRHVDPPCPPALGGWPRGIPAGGRGEGNLDFDLGDLRDSGAAVDVATFRPSDDQAVVVVAATDLDAVESHLRPQLGDRLCVVPSRWTRTQIDEVERTFKAMSEPWLLYAWGEKVDEFAQTFMTVSLVHVGAEVAAWTATQPDGLIHLKPCLQPSSS